MRQQPVVCMSTDDEELIQRWQSGDGAAFEGLVERWQGPLGRFLGRLCREPDTVGDLSQEVFLRVYQARERYQENGAFAAWLYRIALNVARDHGRRPRLPRLHLGPDPASRAASADTICQQRELSDAVGQAVADLPETLREVLVLRHYEEMNFERIADLLGLPPSTVKSRFVAALARLRVRLKELGVVDWEHD